MLNSIKQKYRNMSVPVRASLWFVICGVLKDVVDVLMTPVFTRILTTEQYGYYNVYNSWFQIVKIIFTLYLFSDVFNVGLARFEDDREKFISSTLGFITASVVFFLSLYLVLNQTIDRIIGSPQFLTLLLFAHVLAYVPYYCWIRRERFDYHYRLVVVVSFLYIILQPLLGIVAILCLDIPMNPGHTRIISAVAIQIIIGTILYVGMMRRGKSFYDRKYWKYSLKTGIELIPFNLSKVILNQSDRIMINYFSGSGDTGIYSVAHSAAFAMQVLTESLNGAFVPWLYRKLKTRQLNGIRITVNAFLLLVAVGVVGVELIAPEVMMILGSEAYYQGVNCIPSLVYSVFLIYVYTLFTDVELYFGKNSFVTTAASVGMFANILLNAIFIPHYGFAAAGYTTMLSYLIMCAGHFFFLRKCLKQEEIEVNALMDIRFLFFISAMLLIVTLLTPFIYQTKVLRWSVIVFLVVILAVTWRKWWGFLKTMKEGEGCG